ncbi:hypothetical protein GGTG_13983 [Gaeumannomyces tritici R3-111a-1]|uniref:Uncharacterized protein n=1 Tax=Gaeumannomyces tritici (strain R3-111a-1) TaxID=644352 RepID=J3PKC9_GAET3|nr:hypothetical protein GGTG_13983 [Gaeumannomyces tritici R3-111a-1]EJT68443.1 hypothetical protein GGTG_13983 [Gaeumannomyces tritici R3-111a-1]
MSHNETTRALAQQLSATRAPLQLLKTAQQRKQQKEDAGDVRSDKETAGHEPWPTDMWARWTGGWAGVSPRARLDMDRLLQADSSKRTPLYRAWSQTTPA